MKKENNYNNFLTRMRTNPLSASLAALATLASRNVKNLLRNKVPGSRIQNTLTRTNRSTRTRVEVDKNEGGRKQNYSRLKVITISIDAFLDAVATRTAPSLNEWRYTIAGDTDSTNLSLHLNNAPELVRWKEIGEQIKPVDIGITINYSRQPKSGEVWPKWQLLFNTTKLQAVPVELPYNNNTMTLDMNYPGNKVYKMRYTINNVEKYDLDWRDAEEYQFPRTDIIYRNDHAELIPDDINQTSLRIGQIHIYAKIKVRVPEYRAIGNTRLIKELRDDSTKNNDKIRGKEIKPVDPKPLPVKRESSIGEFKKKRNEELLNILDKNCIKLDEIEGLIKKDKVHRSEDH